MINLLVIYNSRQNFTNTVVDYLEAIKKYSRHETHFMDVGYYTPSEEVLSSFDVLFISYGLRWNICEGNLPAKLTNAIARFRGLKIIACQDEYDYVIEMRSWLVRLGVHVVLTCVPPESQRTVYAGSGLDKLEYIHVLTGYVPDQLMKVTVPKELSKRKWTIGYRGRPLHFKYGRLGYEKILIGKRVKEICTERGIPVNIAWSEEDRIYGPAWPEFIQDCRAMLGTESGSNVFDFEGGLKERIDAFLLENPCSDFDTVHQRFLARLEGNVRMNQISPRAFECIALRTALIQFEGDYSGILRPWDHYLPLKKDFSNIEEILTAVQDDERISEMATQAYQDVIVSGRYGYNALVSKLDECIQRRVLEPARNVIVYKMIGRRDSQNQLRTFRAQRDAMSGTATNFVKRQAESGLDVCNPFHWFFLFENWLAESDLGRKVRLLLVSFPGMHAIRNLVRIVFR